MQHAVDLAHIAIQDGVVGRVQGGRHIGGVQDQSVVGAALDDAGGAQVRVALAGVAGQDQAQVQAADLQRCFAFGGSIGVGHVDLGHAEPWRHGATRIFGIGFGHARAGQGHGQHEQFVAGVQRHIQCGGGGVMAGDVESGAIGQHAAG